MLSSGVSQNNSTIVVEEGANCVATPRPTVIAGSLPPVEPAVARITAEGRLVLGTVSFPAEAVAASLQGAGKLSSAIKAYFQRPDDVALLVSESVIVEPKIAGRRAAAVATLKEVCTSDVFRQSIYPWEVALGSFVKERTLPPEELIQLRALLRQGAEIASACSVIDDAIAYHYQSRSFIRKALDRFSHPSNPAARAIENYLQKQPFRIHDPHFLRIELDKWAQRIDLRDDGFQVVRAVCEHEAAAREILEAGPYTRVVSLAGGVVLSSLAVRDKYTGRVVFNSEQRLEGLYSILSLAKSASGLLQGLESSGVDLARLCSFSNRDASIAISSCAKKISPRTHSRLDEVDSWAARFDVSESQVLSVVDIAELGALLLDAEAVLYTVGQLQGALFGDQLESLWRSKWTKAKSDNEIRTALSLLNEKPAPFGCDCKEAGEAAASAALVLGYSSDERTGDFRVTPESPLQSIAWLMQG